MTKEEVHHTRGYGQRKFKGRPAQKTACMEYLYHPGGVQEERTYDEEPAEFKDSDMVEYWRQALSLAKERQDEGEVYFVPLHLFKVIVSEMKPIKYTKDCFKSTETKMMFEDVDSAAARAEIQTSEEWGMAPYRRTRLRPQIPPIHASEDGTGVAPS